MLEAVIEDIPAEEWLSYQNQYDLAMIRINESIPTLLRNLFRLPGPSGHGQLTRRPPTCLVGGLLEVAVLTMYD